jgi:hypothetical protein
LAQSPDLAGVTRPDRDSRIKPLRLAAKSWMQRGFARFHRASRHFAAFLNLENANAAGLAAAKKAWLNTYGTSMKELAN